MLDGGQALPVKKLKSLLALVQMHDNFKILRIARISRRRISKEHGLLADRFVLCLLLSDLLKSFSDQHCTVDQVVKDKKTWWF